VIDVIEKDRLLANAETVGRLIRDGLAQALSDEKGLVEIRGNGLMIGIELDRPCGALVARGLEAGLLINVTDEKVVRLLPALNFSVDEGQELVARLSQLIRDFLKA
jgi:acetylornithine aminotransferase